MDQELWGRVRHKVLVERKPKRRVMKEEGLAWETLKKILAHSQPPGYRQQQERPKPKLGEHLDWIRQVLASDKEVPRKQRHTAKRLWRRLKTERGFTGGYTIVKEVVRELSRRSQEVFMPLAQRPGTMQMDFGEALVKLGGVLQKVHFAFFALPYSDAVYIRGYEGECTESFWDAHVHAFEYFQGVAWEVTYDNMRIAVAQIIGGGKDRKLTNGFLQLQSHYLFDHRFCRVARPNEKGVVEGMVKFGRSNFLVPIPVVDSMSQLNDMLEQRCREDLQRRVRGQSLTKAQLLEEDRKVFRALPTVPFEACRKESRISNSLSLVRFDDNDYSVPVAYAHHTITLKGWCEEVRIYCGPEAIACHQRIWKKEQVSLDPVHYLALLERKPGALDVAKPLVGLELPECFKVLRRRLENERDGAGTKEYIRVLRLMEHHPLSRLKQAVEKALDIGAITRDAIAQFLMPQPEWRHTVFRMDGHPHLRGVKIEAPNLRGYCDLMAMGGAQ